MHAALVGSMSVPRVAATQEVIAVEALPIVACGKVAVGSHAHGPAVAYTVRRHVQGMLLLHVSVVGKVAELARRRG